MSKAISLQQFLANPDGFTQIGLVGQNIGTEGAIRLAQALRQNNNITDILLSNNQIGDEGVIALGQALQNHSKLKQLHLNNNQIGDEGAIALSEALKNHSNLHALYLNNNQIVDEGAVALADSLRNLRKLNTLDLSNNQIGDGGVTAISQGLAQNQTLSKLCLGSNQIGDEGAVALADSLRNLRKLKFLILNNNQIGDGGAAAIGHGWVESGKVRAQLHLQDNYISSNMVEQLHQQLENVGINRSFIQLGNQLPVDQQPMKFNSPDDILRNFASPEEKVESSNISNKKRLDKKTQKELQIKNVDKNLNLKIKNQLPVDQQPIKSNSPDDIDRISKHVDDILEAKNEEFRNVIQALETEIQHNNSLSGKQIEGILARIKNLEELVTQLSQPELIDSMIEKVKELSESDEFNTGQFADIYNLIEQLQSEAGQMHDEAREFEDRMFIDQGSVSALIVDYYIPAIKARPEQPKLYEELGNLFRDQGDYAKAIKCYKVVNNNFEIKQCYKILLKENPRNPEIMIHYGEHLESIGEFGDAKKHYNNAASVSNDVTLKQKALTKVRDLLQNEQSLIAKLTERIELSHQLDQNAFYNFELVNDEFIQDLLGDAT